MMNIKRVHPFLALIGILLPAGVLLGALYLQFFEQQEPCHLCLLQRCGFMGYLIAMGAYLLYGYSSRYIGLALLAALAGIAVSIRQILLHITSPEGAFMVVWHLHLYTWSFIAFSGMILYCCFILLVNSLQDT